MTQFKLSKRAVEDLTSIWEYTFKIWSEKQADHYYSLLMYNCREIAKRQIRGDKYHYIAPNLYGLRVNRHIIFYRPLDENFIEITRILHVQMDLKNRIME
jgi:toxin ParE1/3/4